MVKMVRHGMGGNADQWLWHTECIIWETIDVLYKFTTFIQCRSFEDGAAEVMELTDMDLNQYLYIQFVHFCVKVFRLFD